MSFAIWQWWGIDEKGAILLLSAKFLVKENGMDCAYK